jgi:ribosome assembly protein YihI (activator of Der GTPase)
MKSQVAASTAATWKVQLDMLLAILSNDGVPEATRQRAQRDVDFLLDKIEALMHAAVSAIPNDTFSRF